MRTALPPEGFEHVRTWTLDTTAELSRLRRELSAETGGDPSRLDPVGERMLLIASELATNALLHGIPPTIVTLSRSGSLLLLDVADHDVRGTPAIAGERAVGMGGFGLRIARRLSQDVGWYADTTTKHVWAVLEAQTA
ncbi:ATP-binding protein [Cellulomonas shaoxiangyii]|uniref:ATP-binding protein n=1 Tax=Cellulomonas shaoxiangyii TaxID=2566013 RepID=A0A4P7SRR0_9CELL|nr:ATP-binding protein [Cellulomonas shaoxiangyii]TGY85084.1 ATP-binding protein [Cellulomonas shaoxiangyii]